MIFCERCGGMVIPKRDGSRTKLVCSSCGYASKEKKEGLVLKEKIKPKGKIEVVEKKVEILPKVDQECPKCKNKKAYFWQVQTRAADEAETTFYKCTKCGHTWRIY